ncbi:MAG: VWA domain-containing protein [Armatimonadetes bacterium]|nr:VWA domain-containing protein [Armatimonadota bacterium]
MDQHETEPPPENDPNRTRALSDPNRTQMLGDPGKTQMAPGPPAAAPTRGLSVEVIPGRQCALAGSPAREQFLIEFKGTLGEFAGGRTPLNICLVIDRSGSMEGEPLDYVKQACGYVVDLLAPDDVLSIVTFEETVDVLMPPSKVMNRDLIKQHINRIVPGNTTNLYDGLALGAQQVLSSREQGRIERLVVFSDGDPTTGIKDFQSLVQHVGEIKKRGITTTFLGFGYEFNEELLAGMAKRSGGNYYFIQRPELIPEVFRTELDKLFTMAARNLVLKFKTARWVQLRQVYGHDVQFGQREVELELADVEKGTALDLAIDLEFQNHPLGHYRAMGGRLTYDDAVSGRQETLDVDLMIEFTSDQARCNVPQDSRVAKSVEVSMASRVVERTMMGLKSGQVTAQMAIADLQKTQMLLAEEGRTEEAKQVEQAIRDLKRGATQEVEKTLIGTVTSLDQGKRVQSSE